ncbi:MAG: membrane dipeptidase [Oscillospiraceae bacterium]|nr:membrane dipeptidase [Oscillospiraceae bacterium]
MDFFDLHCDSFTLCADKGLEPVKGATQLLLDERQGIENWIQLFAVFINDEVRGEKAFAAYRAYVCFIKKYAENNPSLLCLCKSWDEVEAALAAGRCAGILSIENAAALGGRLENIYEAAKDGVRAITLTWNGENEFARGCGEGGHLKPEAKELIQAMRELDIAPDVSHLSDEGLDEALSIDPGAFIATHSNLRTVNEVPRNLLPEHFCEICARGGLVGLNLYTSFIKKDGEPALSDLLRHAYEMLSLGGEKALCMGSDFDGAQMPGFCRGSRDIPALFSSFAREFGEETARGIFRGNASAFFKKLMS